MENFKIDELQDVKCIINFIKNNGIKVLILDSFRRFFLGKENEADAINKIFNTLKTIRKECGDITIITLHHAKKDNSDGHSQDIRDILRGSSDIVNSADSVIGVKRHIKESKLLIEHIKNRSGEEIKGKILQIDNVDGGAYIWEIGDATEAREKPGKSDECADKILNFIEEKQLRTFVKKDIEEITNNYKRSSVYDALRKLKLDGVIIESGATNKLTYMVNMVFSSKEKVESEDESKDDSKQLKL
jgi:hypothetical protein